MLAVAAHPVAGAVLREAQIPVAAVDELRDAGLVSLDDAETVRIVHNRVQDVLAGTIDAAEARRLHGDLGRALAVVSPDRSEALAFHFEEAGELAAAAEALLRAAREATATRAFARARALYGRLLSTRERARIDDGLDVALLIESGEASARAGMSVEAAEAFLVASRRAGADAAMLRVRAAEQLLTAGHLERGRKILDEQLGRVGLTIPSSVPGLVLGVVRDSAGRRVDRYWPRPTSDARLTALWSAFRGAILVEPVRALALGASLVREAARPGATAHARLAAAFIEATSAVAPRGPEALPRALERIAAAIVDRSDPVLAQLHGFAQGAVELLGFAFHASMKSFERVVGVGVEHGLGHSYEETTSRVLQGSSAWSLGDVTHLRAQIVPLCAELEERDDLIAGMLAGMHRSWLTMMEGRVGLAKAQIEELAQRWTARGHELQGWWLDIARLQMALARGDGRTAWRLSLPQARPYRERFFATLMHRLEAQTFLVRSGICIAKHQRATPEELAKAQSAIEDVAAVPSPWTRAHAHCLRAGLASVTGDPAAAIAELRAAAPALDDAHMILMRTLVDDALGTLLGGDEGGALVRSARQQLGAWRFDRDCVMACTLPGSW